MSYYFKPRPRVGDIMRMAAQSASKLRRKGQELHPVDVKTKSGPVAESWWGKAWCSNLESYADYSNRIGRGRSYARNGTVIDLAVSPGKVHAVVQGSRKTPYEVNIEIDPLSEDAEKKILSACTVRAESLDALVKGQFPQEMKDLFSQHGGLFPSPSEIHFGCSCPDWAYMCKHVAAALYGVGVRLDEDPLLFFSLRGINPDNLIDKVIENGIESMLQNVDRPSPRIIQSEDINELFNLS